MSEPEDDVQVVTIDVNVEQWTVREARAYREAVGVNAEYALGQLQLAAKLVASDARQEFGEKTEEDSWEPPADWVPLAMMNIDPAYLLGFAWIGARRKDPDVTYEGLEDSLPVGQLMPAFYAALTAGAEAPLANRAARRHPGPRKGTASRSAASTAGRSATSTN